MKILIHKNEDRGHADYGWLKTKYSFSFGDWYEPTRMGFGSLRVINEDVIAPKQGFPMHSHGNMEIITIVTSGVVSHEDSMGNEFEVKAGEIQVMSAGTGVTHSEKNNSSENLELYQIWIEPKKQNIKPSYSQEKIKDKKDELNLLVSSDGEDGSIVINQDAHLYIGDFKKDQSFNYEVKNGGVYILVISGEVEVGGRTIRYGDAIGVTETPDINVLIKEGAKVLLFDVSL